MCCMIVMMRTSSVTDMIECRIKEIYIFAYLLKIIYECVKAIFQGASIVHLEQ